MEGTEDLRHIQNLIESSSPSSSNSASVAADHLVLAPGKFAERHGLHPHRAQEKHPQDHHIGGADTHNLNRKDEIHASKGAVTTDSTASLKTLLERIPITPLLNGRGGDGGGFDQSHHRVPRGGGILDLDPELELKQDDTVYEAILLLHRNSVQGAPVVDYHGLISSTVTSVTGGFRDREMGFLHLSALVLWCLEEMNKTASESDSTVCSAGNFLQTLQQRAQNVAGAKMMELVARSPALWEPFFPVSSEETLLHVLLLLAKHPHLSIVPVTQPRPSSRGILTYISQKSAVQLLLQSSGLNWFDQIADKRLSDFRFRETRRSIPCIDGEQSVADGFHMLWTNEADVLPIVVEGNGGKRKLIGSLTRNHVLLLLENDGFFDNRRRITVNNFLAMTEEKNHPTAGKEAKKALPNPVTTNQYSDSLKDAMRNMISKDSGVSFLVEVDEAGHEVVAGSVTLKDTIVQFSPPSSDASVAGFGFFESALDDTGCCVKSGVMVCK